MKIENIIMKYLNKKIMALILCLLFFAIPMIVNAAEPTGDKLDGDVLNNITVRFRPVGSISALAVKDNGAWGQNVVHMYHLGESSRFYLIKADSDSYYIRFFSDNTKDSSDLAHIEDRYSEKILDLESNDNYQREGSVVHVVTGNETANNKRWKFYKQEDGTYLIVNKVSNQYWSLKDNDINANENKLCQSKTPFYWEIEIVDCPNNRSIDSDLKRYDSYTFMHDDERVSSINWMSKLPDYIPITDLNIPGVHDAATVSMDLNIASSCQMLYIDDLLDAGVRYFDLRLGTSLLAEGDSLTLQHGVDNCLNRHYDLFYMDELFLWYIDFLDKNPGETVIFQVLNVGGSEKEIYNYFKRFAEGSDYLYIGDHVPTLGEVRGKIVLISRIDLSKVSEDANYDIEIDGKTMQWALDCRNWQIGKNNNTAFVTSGKDFEVWSQDNYDMSADDKWPWVDGSISNAKNRKEIAEENGKKAWVVSYTSVSHLPGTTPLSGARNMNRRVKNAMNSNRWESDSGFLGVICSDFMDEQLSQMIYKTNFDREFEKPITYYNISFVNDDGSVLQSCEVAEGVLPEYSGDVPTKSGDEEYTYEFLEWTPEIEEACEDATYTATYTAIKKEESGDIENPSGDVSTESGDTEKPSGDVSTESGDTEKPSGDVSTESGDTEKPSGDTPSESGETINKEDKPTNNKGGSSSGGSSSSSYKITTISNEKNIEISPKNPTVKRNND